MAYTAWSVTTGETPSASKWNQLGENDAGFKDGTNIDSSAITPNKLLSGTGTSWVWQSYTPTMTAVTLGNGTLACAYTQIGKTVIVRFRLTFGSTTSFSGTPKFTLPVNANSAIVGGYAGGSIRLLDAGIAGYSATIFVESATTFLFFGVSSLGTYAGEYGLSSTVPFTWGNSDALHGVFTYEAA